MATLPETARTIFHQALADCNVERAVARLVFMRDASFYIGGEAIPLDTLRRIRIIAAGKAANAMLLSILQRLPPTLKAGDIAGIVIAPEPPSPLPAGFEYFAAGHPVPNQASFAAARATLDMARGVAEEAGHEPSLCLFLISGGASAMMELPLDPEISLADTVEFHRVLVASGASITEINCVRKHFSAVKGGRLALAADGALCRSLLISDVPAGREDALGSGPTLPDTSTVAECREVVARYGLLAQFLPAVREFFESSALLETPKPNQLQAKAFVLLGPNDLAHAAAHRAHALGFTPIIDNVCNDWEYRAAAKYLLDRLRILRREHSRICLISVGEVAVSLPTQPADVARIGTGGRNQQFALYAATLLRREDGPVAVLSAGSDGIDGNSPAAGAVIDQDALSDDRSPYVQNAAREALANFDAFPFLKTRDRTIVTGPSGNNLRDLRILMS